MKLSDLLATPTTQTIDLGEWNQKAAGKLVYVWVDPPKPFLQERDAFSREYADFIQSLTTEKGKMSDPKTVIAEQTERLTAFVQNWQVRVYTWYCQLWNQGPEESRWSVDEIKELDAGNPQLLKWLFERSKIMLDTYGRAEKNA